MCRERRKTAKSNNEAGRKRNGKYSAPNRYTENAKGIMGEPGNNDDAQEGKSSVGVSMHQRKG